MGSFRKWKSIVSRISQKLKVEKFSCRNMTYNEWAKYNNIRGVIPLKDFMVSSPGWIDPEGRMVVASRDIRPFQYPESQPNFYMFFNTMEGEKVFEELSDIAERPYGMAWSMDGTTLFYSDGIKK